MRILTGTGSYVDDIQLPGMLHAAFLRSPLAHARILSVDVSAARQLPGVPEDRQVHITDVVRAPPTVERPSVALVEPMRTRVRLEDPERRAMEPVCSEAVLPEPEQLPPDTRTGDVFEQVEGIDLSGPVVGIVVSRGARLDEPDDGRARVHGDRGSRPPVLEPPPPLRLPFV